MENIHKEPAVNKRLSTKALVLIGLIILLIATLAYGYYQNRTSGSKNSTSSSEWTEYKSEKYGFKFDYPKEWGDVSLNVTEQNKNKYYRLDFISNRDNKRTRSVTFESLTNKDQICDSKGQCGNSGNIERSNILDSLKTNKDRYVAYDSNSYAVLVYDPNQKVSVLSDYRIIELSKLNVSAAVGTLSMKNSSDKCPSTKFLSGETIQKCINIEEYTAIDKVLQSIKQI